MSDDLRSLRQLLRQAIEATNLTVRQIEAEVGLSHGKLDHLLDGRQELRVRHLLGFARLLKVPPQDFLALGCPGAQETAKYRLKQWIEPPPFGPRSGEQNGGAEPELAELVRDAVRKELAGSLNREELAETIRGVVREELDAARQKPGRRSER